MLIFFNLQAWTDPASIGALNTHLSTKFAPGARPEPAEMLGAGRQAATQLALTVGDEFSGRHIEHGVVFFQTQ